MFTLPELLKLAEAMGLTPEQILRKERKDLI